MDLGHQRKPKTKYTGVFLQTEQIVPEMGVSGSRSDTEVSALKGRRSLSTVPSLASSQQACKAGRDRLTTTFFR